MGCCCNGSCGSKYDKLFVNGKIYTVDQNRSWAQAIAISGNEIAFVGNDEEAEALKCDAAEVIDLKGKMVLPGFVEAHAHVTMAATDSVFKVQLFDVATEPEYLEIIKKFVEDHPDLPVYEGVGWINPAFGEKGPSRKALDAICADKPMVMESGDHHSIWANTKAIEICGITKDTEVPDGNVIEKEEDGTPSGCFRELQAMYLINPARIVFSKDNYKEALAWVQKHLAQYGITTMLDPLLNPDGEAVPALIEMQNDGELICKIRAAFQGFEDDPLKHLDKYDALRKQADGNMVRFDQLKIMVDGVVEGRTAYLKQPYSDDSSNYCGDPIWDYDDLVDLCKKVDQKGMDVHYHIIGDAAAAMMLDCLEDMAAANPDRKDRRPVCTHLQVVDPADIPRIAANNVVAVTNPYWHFKAPGYFTDIEVPYLGDRAYHEYPMKSLFDAGIVVGAASDFNVTPIPAPLRGIQLGVTRTEEGQDSSIPENVLWGEEAATVAQMIEAFTINNAMACRDEAISGSLEVGKRADMVIIEKNIFDIPVNEIGTVKVVQTISEGKVIYEG